MRVTTKTFTLYPVDELTEKAQQRAYYEWLENFDYPWAKENRESLEAFQRIFPVRVTDWRYSDQDYDVRFELTIDDDDILNMRGVRLYKYIYNNYYSYITEGKYFSKDFGRPGEYRFKGRHSKIIVSRECALTGFVLDNVILGPVYNFLDSPLRFQYWNLYDLMRECLMEWGRACRDDMECQTSFECFLDDCRTNKFEFTEDGELA